MASLGTEGSDLVVRLSALERLGAFKPFEPRVPLAKVRRFRVSNQPWRELRGIRAPGTGMPWVIMLGTTRHAGGKDFCAIYGRGPAVVVELCEAPYGRFFVSTDNAREVASRLGELIGAKGVTPEPAF